MRDIVHILSEQHVALLHAGMELDVLLDPSPFPLALFWAKLKAFELALMSHLALEDRDLYEALGHDKHDYAAQHAMQLWQIDHAREFFSWWPTPDSIDSAAFAESWPIFFEGVKARMQEEESVIFGDYLMITGLRGSLVGF